MEQISVYFKKFSGIGEDEHKTKKNLLEAIVETIEGVSEDEIGDKKIIIKKDTIEIKIVGPLKNEIVLHKNEIQKLFDQKNKNRILKNINKKII
jgi:hypothetical protein